MKPNWRSSIGPCLLCIAATASCAALRAGELELRAWVEQRGIADSGRPLPADAARAFVYEGEPRAMRVAAGHVTVDYGRSGVRFDRATGAPVGRWTVLEGWPTRRPADFPPESLTPYSQRRLVGPGVLNPYLPPYAADYRADALQPTVVCQAEFAGRTFRAVQPKRFLLHLDRPELPGGDFAWSDILRRLGEASYVEAAGGSGQPRRYTTDEGLPSNIVTHLASHGGRLWAACVDIHDERRGLWGPGGLCWYDRDAHRWQRAAKIDGRDVRWVTLLEVHGDELWVGFREGEGIAGDRVAMGMGTYPGFYRPKATAIVLARLAGGQWTTFTRPPRPEVAGALDAVPMPPGAPERPTTPSTEYPASLARLGDRVLLFTLADARQLSGNWEVRLSGHVSALDLKTGRWRAFDAWNDLGADELIELVAEEGEILVASNRGAHRYDAASDSWRPLDPQCVLKNPNFPAGAVAGDELWLGYARQAFGVVGRQGISRYSEKTGRWTYMPPEELGTGSPVRRIVALENSEVWVLFGAWPYMGAAAMPSSYYPSEHGPRPTGLGRWAGGKWEFPAGVPPEGTQPRSFVSFGATDDLAAVGNRLVYCARGAVHVGPKPWTRVAEGNILGIRPTGDGKAVEIVRQSSDGGQPEPGPGRFERGLATTEGKPVAFQPVAFGEPGSPVRGDPWSYAVGDSLLAYERSAGEQWVRLPAAGGATWAVGPLNVGPRGTSNHRTVLATDRAYWIFSHGEVIRLERAAIDALTRQGSLKKSSR